MRVEEVRDDEEVGEKAHDIEIARLLHFQHFQPDQAAQQRNPRIATQFPLVAGVDRDEDCDRAELRREPQQTVLALRQTRLVVGA